MGPCYYPFEIFHCGPRRTAVMAFTTREVTTVRAGDTLIQTNPN